MKIKGVINTGFANSTYRFEYDIEELGYDLNSWKELSEDQIAEILDEVSETELGNRIEVISWVEGD